MINRVGQQIKQKILMSQKRLPPIERAVRSAENKLAPLYIPTGLGQGNNVSFNTSGPRGAVYRSTPSNVLLKIFENVEFPWGGRFADLGSGLGIACFTASFFFKDITGFELDHRLFDESKNIKQRFTLNNVLFKNNDFLQEDLRPYNVVFIFEPFLNDFTKLMPDLLNGLNQGTIVISYGRKDIFDWKHYKSLYPDLSESFLSDILPYMYVCQRI